jgi:ribonuclease HI
MDKFLSSLSDNDIITVYTDGACEGNPGAGGWGAIFINQKNEYEISGFEKYTTNNRMELKAVIEGLKLLPNNVCVKIYTDSKYVMDGIESWIKKWKENGWMNYKKQPVKNKDLWELLDHEVSKFNKKVEWNWVKGHSTNVFNNRVDAIAKKAIISYKMQ